MRRLLPLLAALLPACLNAQAVDTTGWTVTRTVARVDTTWAVAAIDTTWRTDSLPITQPKPPVDTVVVPPPVAGSNEPKGFTRLTARDCQASTEDGWTAGNANFAIVKDATSPTGSACETTFRTTQREGTAPVTIERILATRPSALYVRYWEKTSPNWVSHPILTKQFHFWINSTPAQGGNKGFTALYGTGNTGIYTQGVLSKLGTLGSGATPRGAWHLVEVLLETAPGTVTLWLDGRQVLRQPVTWGGASAPNRWEKISWSPTWGGNTGKSPVRQMQTSSFTGLYVSGR